MAGRKEPPPEAPEGPGTIGAVAKTESPTSAPNPWTVRLSLAPERGDRKEGRHTPGGRPNSEAWRRCQPTEVPPSERNRPEAGD